MNQEYTPQMIKGYFIAVQNAEKDKIEEFIKEKGIHPDFGNDDNYSRNALHVLAKDGNLELFKFYVEHLNADIDYLDELGDAPINIAVENGHMSLVKYLIEKNSKRTDQVITFMKDYGLTFSDN